MSLRLFFIFIATIITNQYAIAQRSLLDSLPVSEIDIPIRINLRPFFKLAERNVDTVFTSPGYPNGWVEADCATRYKYRFRRSPLKLSANGNAFTLGFTGLYQIIGSTRACMKGTVMSPWTPPCTCGVGEGERRVEISFTSNFNLAPNGYLFTRIKRNEPRALDKCSVCFWGQDITSTVMDGLKKELDAAKKSMEDSFGRINLKPYLQQAWDQLNTVYNIPGAGYFALHPKKIRIHNMDTKNDFLNITIGITSTPVISLHRPDIARTVVPDLSRGANTGGFNIHLEAALQYDSLTAVLNGMLVDKRFEISEGLFKKHVVIANTVLSADTVGNLLIDVDFAGSFNGRARFVGKPYYDTLKKTIEVEDLEYDVQSKSFLINTAKWLFNKRITSELKKYTSFPMTSYYDSATRTMNNWLNREWMKGIHGKGSVHHLTLSNVYALPEHLLIRSNCQGKLDVYVDEINLKFQ